MSSIRRLLIAALALLGIGWDEAPAPKDKWQEFRPQLKSAEQSPNGVVPTGPDAATCVLFEDGAIHIKLPTGYNGKPGFHGERPDTGIIVPIEVKGDFEITVSYENLVEPAKADAGSPQTRLTLDVATDRTANVIATLSRRMTTGGSGYFAWKREIQDMKDKGLPSKAMSGRMRLARRGSTISYSVSSDLSGDSFNQFAEFPFSTDDLVDVRVVGSTGGTKAALEAKITGIVVRGQSLSRIDGPAPAVALGASATSPSRNRTLLIAGIIGVLVALAAVTALVIRLRSRKATSPAATPPGSPSPAASTAFIEFSCSSCGKKLKVRANAAGKQVACPGCKKPNRTPQAAT